MPSGGRNADASMSDITQIGIGDNEASEHMPCKWKPGGEIITGMANRVAFIRALGLDNGQSNFSGLCRGACELSSLLAFY
jgi:hypothetical protein